MNEENEKVLRKMILINNNLIWVAIVLSANAFIFSMFDTFVAAAAVTLVTDLLLLLYWWVAYKKIRSLV